MPKSAEEDQIITSDYYDWAGIDHITSPFLVADNKLIQCVNFTSTGIVGGKTTRSPYSLFLDKIDSSKVQNLIYFVYANNDGTTTGYLIRVSNKKLYSYQIGGVATSWGSALAFTPTVDTPFAFATLANGLHLSNGTDNYQTWTPGGGFVSSSTAPKVRTMVPYQRRIFGANAPGNTSRTYFSSVDYTQAPGESSTDPWYSDNNNPSTANYFDVDPEHNGGVGALDVVNNNLTMHKSSGGLYIYNGNSISNPLQSNNPYFNSPGESTVSPYAIDQISGIEFYLNRDNVYAYQGGYPSPISYEVYDFIQNMPGANYTTAAGICFKNKYYLAIGTTTDAYGHTVTNCVLVYDYILNIWETYSLHDFPTCWCVYVDANGDQQLLFGDANGYVYKWNTGTGDNGSPSTAVLQTHYLTWGSPEKTKDVVSYTYSTNPGANFQLQYATDWKDNWQPFNNTSGYGVSSGSTVGMRNFKSIAFKLTSNTVIPMKFYGLTLKVNVGSRRNSGRRL